MENEGWNHDCIKQLSNNVECRGARCAIIHRRVIESREIAISLRFVTRRRRVSIRLKSDARECARCKRSRVYNRTGGVDLREAGSSIWLRYRTSYLARHSGTLVWQRNHARTARRVVASRQSEFCFLMEHSLFRNSLQPSRIRVVKRLALCARLKKRKIAGKGQKGPQGSRYADMRNLDANSRRIVRFRISRLGRARSAGIICRRNRSSLKRIN